MTTLSDGFTRANETPLAGNWATGSGSAAFNLTSNAAVPSALGSDCAAIYTAATWGNDQSSAAKLTVNSTGGTGEGPGLIVRHAAGARTCYRMCMNHAASNNGEMGRFLAGSFTSLLVFTRSFTDGDTFELRVVGPQTAAVVTIWHNGVQIQSFTDNSTIASGTPGIAYSSVAGSPTTIDDWTATDFASDGLLRTFNPIPFMGGL